MKTYSYKVYYYSMPNTNRLNCVYVSLARMREMVAGNDFVIVSVYRVNQIKGIVG